MASRGKPTGKTTSRRASGKTMGRASGVSRTGAGALALPVRCPNCYASLRKTPPTAARAVAAAALVARHALDDEEVTADALAEELSTPAQAVSPKQASNLLLRATRDGLLRRTRHTQLAGGFHYRYQPAPALVAYLPDDVTALALADLLGLTPRAVRLLEQTMYAPVSTLGETARSVRNVASALAPAPRPPIAQ